MVLCWNTLSVTIGSRILIGGRRPMARKTRRAEAPDKRHLNRGRHPKTSAGDSPNPATQEGQGFLFDPYWDEAFSAYYDPTLRTCCQLKY
jgi:hypothetical protein